MRWVPAVAILATMATGASDALAQEITPPTPVLRPVAEWPDEPRRQDVVVPVVLTIASDGAVEHVSIVRSAGPRLDAAVVRTARQWVFQPARRDGEPVASKVRAELRFVAPPPQADREPVSDEVDGAPAPREELGDQGVEVITVGRARPRSASQVSRDRDLLGASPSRTGSDLLRTVPGVFTTQHSGEGKAHQVFFRGFDAVHGQDLEIDVGGAPVNEVSNVHGQGYADLHFVIPEVVDRIDALPGAFDPSQGDFAIAGSMRYHLGYDEPGITTGASYGSFNTRRLFLAYHPEGQPKETFAAGEAYATDGFGVGRAARRGSVIGQVLVPLADGLSGRVLATVYAGRFGSAGVVPRADVIAGRIDRFDSYDTDQGGRSARSQLVTELRYEGETWQASLAPFLIRRSLELRFNFTGFVDDPDRGDNAIQRHDFTALGVTGTFEKTFDLLSERDSIGGGIYARHDIIDQSHEPSHGEGPAFVDASVDATDVGSWAELALRPWSRMVIRGGARFDSLSFRVDDTLSNATRSAQGIVVTPKASVDVGIVAGLNVIASYGQGFRSPQARSLGDGETLPFTRTNGWELGLRYRDGRGIEASLAGYVTLLDDDLVFNEATARNEAIPGTLRIGGAANLEARPNDWFVAAAGGSYTRATLRGSNARLAEGDLLPFVPQLILRSDTAARPVLTRFVDRDLRGIFGLGTSYVFNRPLPFGEVGTDIFLVDARVGVRWGEVELRVDATNLLDAEWNDGEFVYASSFEEGAIPSLVPRRHFSAGAPQTFLGTLTLHL